MALRLAKPRMAPPQTIAPPSPGWLTEPYREKFVESIAEWGLADPFTAVFHAVIGNRSMNTAAAGTSVRSPPLQNR